MEDSTMKLSREWENGIIRKALVDLGDEEALRLFDEERAKAKKKAQEEVEAMIKAGECIV